MRKVANVRVGVVWVASKGQFLLKWKDPRTLKYATKTTGINVNTPKNLRKAIKLAEAHQAELMDSFARDPDQTTWEQFRKMYESERLPRTSIHNRRKWKAAAAIFEQSACREVVGPLHLADITPRMLIRFEAHARKTLSAGSIASYSATLRAGLSWAAKVGLMPMLPARPPEKEDIELPAMRLRPITGEDLERMEAACAKVAGKAHAQSIADYIRCLWLSGCRLMEPLWIHPFRRDCHHPLVLDGERPMMAWANRQKNRKDQIARITLDFAAFLRPRMDTDQFLFNPTCSTGRIEVASKLSDLISEIGSQAGVIAEPGDPGKTATAKHFRSSFVTRWALRGMPKDDIRAMARHSSITTTEKYYLAPIRPETMKEFHESDWLVSKSVSETPPRNSETEEKPANSRGDGRIRTDE